MWSVKISYTMITQKALRIRANALECHGHSATEKLEVSRENRYSWMGRSSTGILHHWIWATTRQNQQSGCASSEDSDQTGHPPSLIRVFTVGMKKPWVLSYPLSAQRRLWSDWADLSLCWAHGHFVGFVMSRLILYLGHSNGKQGLNQTGAVSLCYRNDLK